MSYKAVNFLNVIGSHTTAKRHVFRPQFEIMWKSKIWDVDCPKLACCWFNKEYFLEKIKHEDELRTNKPSYPVWWVKITRFSDVKCTRAIDLGITSAAQEKNINQ